MRTAKGPSSHKSVLAVEQSTHAVHLGGLDRLAQSERRQNGRDPFGNHRFPRTGWADAKNVVPTGGGDFDRPFYMLLPFDLPKIKFLFTRSRVGPIIG